MRPSQAFVVSCLASVLVLTACSQPAGRPARAASDASPPVVRRLTPREGVHYFNVGVHAAAETSVGVGVLRYRSTTATQGTWMLVPRRGTASPAGDTRPFATLTGIPGFDKDFWPLDGQYVAVEGSVVAVSGRVSQLRVEALCCVSDIFPMKTDEFSAPGLYDQPDGSKLVIGWVGERSGTLTTLYDAPTEGTGTVSPRPIARVKHAKQKRSGRPVMEADVYVVQDGDPPLVRAIEGRVTYLSAIGWRDASERRQWLDLERAGVKDLPGGKTRVVGVVDRRYLGEERSIPVAITVTEPWYPGIRGVLGYLQTVTLARPERLDQAADGYVAAEGILKKDPGGGYGYTLETDELQQIEIPPLRYGSYTRW